MRLLMSRERAPVENGSERLRAIRGGTNESGPATLFRATVAPSRAWRVSRFGVGEAVLRVLLAVPQGDVQQEASNGAIQWQATRTSWVFVAPLPP